MKRTSEKAIDGGAVASLTFDIYSGGKKAVKVAPKLTHLKMSDKNVASVSKGRTLYIFNKSTELQWVFLFGEAPEGEFPSANFENSFPLKPMDWTVLNSGDNECVGCVSADVGVYLMADESKLV